MGNRILAIVVAAVVVVAVVIAAVALTGDRDPTTSEYRVEGLELMVYGNANNDLTIDEDDLALVQSIMDGDVDDWESEYPLADANCDGVVDDEDIQLIRQLVDREECTVYVACQDANGNEAAVSVDYPLNNITVIGVGAITSALYTNATDNVVAYAPNSYAQMNQSLTGTNIFGTIYIDLDLFSQVDRETPVDAVFIDAQYTYMVTDNGYSVFELGDIPYLVYSVSSPEDHTSAALTIGFLCGTETESVGYQFASSTVGVIEHISETLGDISDDEKAVFMTLAVLGTTICQNDHPNQEVGTFAGGIPYHQTNEEFASLYEGTGTSSTASDALAEFRDADAYFFIGSKDFGQDPDEVIIGIMEPSTGPIIDFYYDAIENWYFINNLLPGAVKIAYAAEALYPELFEGYGDRIAQQFIDEGYDPFVGQTVESLCGFFTYQDYLDAKAAQGS